MFDNSGLAGAIERAAAGGAQGQTIVLVTGVFDILHTEHTEFLTAARQAGDVLIVGIESDVRVRQLKGEGRPVNSQADRQLALEALHLADHVFILPEQFSSRADHEALISQIKPQILAVSEHTPHLAEKRQILAKHGGKVLVVRPHNPAISTTLLLNQKPPTDVA